MVIVGGPGSGKKHLLAKWFNYHKKQEENSGKSKLDFMLTSWNSLGGNNVSYSYTIYNILINLKVNIKAIICLSL